MTPLETTMTSANAKASMTWASPGMSSNQPRTVVDVVSATHHRVPSTACAAR